MKGRGNICVGMFLSGLAFLWSGAGWRGVAGRAEQHSGHRAPGRWDHGHLALLRGWGWGWVRAEPLWGEPAPLQPHLSLTCRWPGGARTGHPGQMARLCVGGREGQQRGRCWGDLLPEGSKARGAIVGPGCQGWVLSRLQEARAPPAPVSGSPHAPDGPWPGIARQVLGVASLSEPGHLSPPGTYTDLPGQVSGTEWPRGLARWRWWPRPCLGSLTGLPPA